MQYFGFQGKGSVRFPVQYTSLISIIISNILRSPYSVCILIYQSGQVHIYTCCECAVSPKPLDILDLLSACLLNRGQAHIRYVKHVSDVSQMRDDFSAHTVSTAYLGCTDLTAPACVDLTWTSTAAICQGVWAVREPLCWPFSDLKPGQAQEPQIHSRQNSRITEIVAGPMFWYFWNSCGRPLILLLSPSNLLRKNSIYN